MGVSAGSISRFTRGVGQVTILNTAKDVILINGGQRKNWNPLLFVIEKLIRNLDLGHGQQRFIE